MCILFGFSAKADRSEQDSLIVSVITCQPGREIYELCGHEAIRVRGIMNGVPMDSVWNYGIFDFAQPNFVYRFVKGETDYRVAGYPFSWFTAIIMYATIVLLKLRIFLIPLPTDVSFTRIP